MIVAEVIAMVKRKPLRSEAKAEGWEGKQFAGSASISGDRGAGKGAAFEPLSSAFSM
jgi:hypothetical protein